MKHNSIEELIAKDLLGESLTGTERQQLETWIDADPSHREHLYHFRQTRFSKSRYEAYRKINADRAYKKFLKQTRSISRLKNIRWGIAASLILMFLIGGFLWYYINQYPRNEIELVADITPGTTHAVLQTASGSLIEFDEQKLAQKSVSISGVNLQTTPRGIVVPSVDNTASQKGNRYEIESQQNELRTGKNGEFYIVLEDRTVVHLNYNTTLRYPIHFSSKERVVYLEGEAYFEVSEDLNRPFKVMTRDVVIRQYGTIFNVNTYSEHFTEVVLVDGSIGVKTSGENYILKPSEKLCVNSVTNHFSVEQVDVRNYISWHEGRFIFENESLDHIMKTLSHWYNVEVVFDSPELKHLHFTGNLDRYGKLTPILRSIAQTVGLRFEIKNRIIYFYQ